MARKKQDGKEGGTQLQMKPTSVLGTPAIAPPTEGQTRQPRSYQTLLLSPSSGLSTLLAFSPSSLPAREVAPAQPFYFLLRQGLAVSPMLE